MIYFDTSALVKFVLDEAESAQLIAWLGAQAPAVRVSSSLARVEIRRAVGPQDQARSARVSSLINGLTLVPLANDLLDDAGALPYSVRSLDAIHLTSALRLRGDLRAFVAYDKRLLAAAEQAGLPIAAPGAT